ncbi:hypothetical protein [Halostella salina]|nr:hypothetical protein [Halostella salina]
MIEHAHDDERPVSRAQRWLHIVKLLLTVIAMLIGILETLGLL